MNNTIFKEIQTNTNGICGLDNLGNTCYLNSIIQSLINCTHFKDFIINKNFIDYLLHKINTQETEFQNKLKHLNDSSIYQFYRLTKALLIETNNLSSMKPSTLRKKIGLKNSMFRNTLQQDAHEAFCILIEMMHLEISKSVSITSEIDLTNPLIKSCVNFWAKDYSPIYNIFHGMYCITKTCQKCFNETISFDANLFLELSVPELGTSSIVHKENSSDESFCLSKYINITCKIPSIKIPSTTKELMMSMIDKDIIDKINEKHKLVTSFNCKYDIIDCINDFIAAKDINEFKCPNCDQSCTCVEINRIAIPPKVLCIHIKRFNNNLIKINNEITFPLELNIDKLLLNFNKLNINYKLKSIINHSGNNINFGHYYTYTFSIIHNKWFEFNDDTVTEISNDKLCTPEAYLLFYELN
jgi:ubiquitin C-terminal hydrolase